MISSAGVRERVKREGAIGRTGLQQLACLDVDE